MENVTLLTYQALLDSGISAYIGREHDRVGVVWALILDPLLPLDAGGGERGVAPTIEDAVEDLAAAANEAFPDSDFARFYQGEVDYFRCGVCGTPRFGVKPLLDRESGECCPQCVENEIQPYSYPDGVILLNKLQVERLLGLFASDDEAAAIEYCHRHPTRPGVYVLFENRAHPEVVVLEKE